MITALSPDILENLPDPFSMPADISYSVILRSQLLTPVLAAWPTLSAMQHRKSFYSLQKQTWTIKGTLSIRIIIWHYSGDSWCSHGSMGGHSGEGRAQGCKVKIFYNLSYTYTNWFWTNSKAKAKIICNSFRGLYTKIFFGIKRYVSTEMTKWHAWPLRGVKNSLKEIAIFGSGI